MQNACNCNNRTLDLLKKYSISISQIAKASGCDRKTVTKIVSGKCSSKSTRNIVRKKSVDLLYAMGWKGDPDSLWDEYDNNTEERAA